MSANCNIIIIFPMYGQFRVIRKPDSERSLLKKWKQNPQNEPLKTPPILGLNVEDSFGLKRED